MERTEIKLGTAQAEVEFPIRLNRFLALSGSASRRGADELIAAGRVFVNGRKASLGDKVGPTDTVEVAGAKAATHFAYVAWHKPADELLSDVDGLMPLLPLDRRSSGIEITTNDMKIRRLMTGMQTPIQEFIVSIQEGANEGFARRIGERLKKNTGVRVSARSVNARRIRVSGPLSASALRRACTDLRHTPIGLERLKIGPIALGSLAQGGRRNLSKHEVDLLFQALSENETS